MFFFIKNSAALIRKAMAYDVVYASFWLALVIVFFFFPVMLGLQSLTEAVPTFYSHLSPEPAVKTLWQIDGGTHAVGTVPINRAAASLIQKGVAPIWSSYDGGGGPLLSDVASGMYYPLRSAFFSLWNSTRAFDWYFILRFFIAGLGMFFYLRAIGLRRIVSLWGGIAYAFTGYFILYLTYPFLDIDALMPWTLLAVENYLQKRSASSAAVIGLLLAMTIVISQPQSTLIAFMLVALYFAWRIITQDKIDKQLLKPLFHAFFALLTAILIASPFIADFLVNYSQGATIPDWATKGLAHFSPIHLLHFFVTPSMMPEVAASGHLWDRLEIIIPYFGISVLILALLSLFLKNKPRQLWPLYAWIMFVVLKNAGFPLVQWLGKLPILSQIGWHKAYGPMAGAIVICAAIAFEHILRNGDAAIPWRRFYKFLATIPLAFGAAYFFAKNAFFAAYVPNFDFANRDLEKIKKVTALTSRWPTAIRDFALNIMQGQEWYLTIFLFLGTATIAITTLLIVRFLQQGKRNAALAIIFLTVFELWFYMPKIRDGFQYFDPYAETPPYVKFLQNQTAERGIERTFSIGGVFAGHIGELYKIQTSQNTFAVKSQRYFALLPDIILEHDPLSSTITAEKFSEIPTKFFDAYNIRYLLSEQSLPDEPWLSLIYDKDIKIYENKNALPKAYVVFEKQSAISPKDARRIFYDTPFDPYEAIILEDSGAVSLPANISLSFQPITVRSYRSNEVFLETETDRAGILVLTDSFYPGWNAYLDGTRVPVYPANILFRSIHLPAGTHEIRFIYEPWWFWPSVIVSLLTISGIIFLVMYPKHENGEKVRATL